MKNALITFLIGAVMTTTPVSSARADTNLPVFDLDHTAIVITDPQKEFLHEDGKLYGLVAPNMEALGTIENIETLMKTSKDKNITLAVDPLVYTRLDVDWANAGVLQRQLLDLKALYSETADSKDLEGTGADFYGPYKQYIHDGETLIASPHKMYGPESNDLMYQLRSHGVDTVILAGLVANLCVDSHMRTLMENGFKVYVVKDAVAAPGEDAYNAALVNYGMIANGVLTTAEVVEAVG